MWIHLVPLGLIDGASPGDVPPPQPTGDTAGAAIAFDILRGRRRPQDDHALAPTALPAAPPEQSPAASAPRGEDADRAALAAAEQRTLSAELTAATGVLTLELLAERQARAAIDAARRQAEDDEAQAVALILALLD